MKIPTIKGEVIDTEKLTDTEAEICEALAHLQDVCQKYNKTIYSAVILNKSQHLVSSGVAKDKDKNLDKDSLEYLFMLMGHFVNTTSGGQIQMFKTKSE